MLGLGIVAAGAVAGVAACALLYLVIVGALSAIGGGQPGGIWQGAWSFGTIFGLLSGAHWSFAVAMRRLRGYPRAFLTARILSPLLVALAILLALTGERWETMFDGLGGPALILVIAWLAMTHFVSKTLERHTPAEKSAGA